MPPKTPRGFTLIELMVVMVLIAVFTTAVAVNLRATQRNSAPENAAKRLFLVMNTANEESVLMVKSYGIRFTTDGYRFYSLEYQPLPEDENQTVAAAVEESDNPALKNLPSIDTTQYHFVWQPMQETGRDSPYRQYQLPEGVAEKYHFEVELEGLPISLAEDTFAKFNQSQKTELKPTLIFSSDGEVIPDFRVRLSDDSGERYYQIELNEDGVLTLNQFGDGENE